MSGYTSADSLIAALAEEARTKAASSPRSMTEPIEAGLVKTFVGLVESRILLKHPPRGRGRSFDFAVIPIGTRETNPLHTFDPLRTLRLNLEVALLRFDACGRAQIEDARSWPEDEDFSRLKELVEDALKLFAKRIPVSSWERMKKLDRHFPRLQCCRRIKNFMDRIAESIPPRPYAEVMVAEGMKTKSSWESFRDKIQSVRSGNIRAEVVSWIEFERQLVFAQDADRTRRGLKRMDMLERPAGTPTGPQETLALLSFLELDRADLLWQQRYGDRFDCVFRGLQGLDARDLTLKLRPYIVGVVDPIQSWVKRHEQSMEALKRASDAARKAKSRKKLGGKV